MDVPSAIAAIDAERLERILNAPGESPMRVTHVTFEEIDFGAVNTTTAGVFRVRGAGVRAGRRARWSAILKVVQAPRGRSGSDPSHWNYWKREALAYGSGLLASLPKGLSAPRCLAVEEPAPRAAWVWMEDLGSLASTRAGRPWSIARTRLAARHLGELNGAYLTGRAAIPTEPWIARGFLAGAVADWKRHIGSLGRADGLWSHPRARSALPRSAREDVLRIYRETGPLLEALARLPQTLGHFDANRANLFSRRREGRVETAAIDWAFLGTGAVGEEIGQLVSANLIWQYTPAKDALRLLNAALSGYLEGLREAGYQGPESAVRLGCLGAAVLRTAFFVPHQIRMITTRELQGIWRARFGRPVRETVPDWARAVTFLLSLADEAQALAREELRRDRPRSA
jgi:hypothetical protein